MKKVISFLLVIILAVGGYFFATPYLALNNMKNAFDNKDYNTLISYVDFPSIRQDIKEQLHTAIRQEIQEKSDTEPFVDGMEDLGMSKETMINLSANFATGIIDTAIDEYLTADNAQKTLEKGEVNFNKLKNIADDLPLKQNGAEIAKNQPENTTAENADVDYNAHYVSINKFAIELFSPKMENEKLTIIMERDGLNWQITQIKLPLDDLK